jgi:hypothetical protein
MNSTLSSTLEIRSSSHAAILEMFLWRLQRKDAKRIGIALLGIEVFRGLPLQISCWK